MSNISDMSELSLTKERQSGFWSLIRSTPLSLLGALVLINIIYPTTDNLMFMLFYMLTFGSNMIFKVIAKGIYNILDTDYIPFIGQGTRPSGAHSCSSFISAPLMPATSFGMPSGHSQLAWFFAVYACLSIIYKWKNNITTVCTGIDSPAQCNATASTVYTGLQAQCNATASTPNSRPPGVGLEFNVGGTSFSVPPGVVLKLNVGGIEWTKKKVILSCSALIVLAITISYSRVSIEGCHTTGQVIIGGLIGSVIALTAFWIKTFLTGN